MAQYLNLKPVDFEKLSKKAAAKVQWEGRIMLPKYDGCFCIVGIWNGKLDFILSRDGKAVKSMDHIYDDLMLRYPWLADETPGERGWAVLGEAWKPGTEFKVISGTFRRQRPQPDLGLAVFDVVRYDISAADNSTPLLRSHEPYAERVARLADARAGLCNVFPPLPLTCENHAHALEYAARCKALGGYDGAILSDPDAPYVVSDGAAGEFLKVKPLMSFTLQCVGVERSKGEKTGRDTCALLVRFKGTTCKVGTGLSEEEQANPEQFILKMIEVQCMDVYAGPDGLMREPRFVGVRDDATPDY